MRWECLTTPQDWKQKLTVTERDRCFTLDLSKPQINFNVNPTRVYGAWWTPLEMIGASSTSHGEYGGCVQVGGEASSSHSLQGIHLGSGDPEGLQHVQIMLSRLPCGHRPVEAMEEACQP
jgi:hypothetical protein